MAQLNDWKAILIDGIVYEKRPDGTLVPIKGESDWARVDATTEEDLARQVAEDEDAVDVPEEAWDEAIRERDERLARDALAPKMKLG